MKKAIIVGASGFGGLGLIELLFRHPYIDVLQLIARKDIGTPICNIFTHLKGYTDLVIEDIDSTRYDEADIVFFSTPDRAGMELINKFHEKNIPVIDFSGDFRFTNMDEYIVYAQNKGMETSHASSHLLAETVYGLPELYKDRIQNAKIVGNPGCFAISMILGLLPLIKNRVISTDAIVCDGKTGVSGAGKNPGEANFYPQRYEDVNTYREGHHQHIVEVENILNSVHNETKKILFIPQVVPMTRGILSTMYADAIPSLSTSKLVDLYNDYYTNAPFVHITEKSPHTTDVRGTNRCLIRPLYDERTGKIFITSVIDNLLKGQSGNAIQNANIMLNFPETTGLELPGFYP